MFFEGLRTPFWEDFWVLFFMFFVKCCAWLGDAKTIVLYLFLECFVDINLFGKKRKIIKHISFLGIFFGRAVGTHFSSIWTQMWSIFGRLFGPKIAKKLQTTSKIRPKIYPKSRKIDPRNASEVKIQRRRSWWGGGPDPDLVFGTKSRPKTSQRPPKMDSKSPKNKISFCS